MKDKLNITIEASVLEQAKRYAARHNSSLSKMVEHYFQTLLRSARKKNILELLEELPQPKVAAEINLKEKYYDQQKKKYGF